MADNHKGGVIDIKLDRDAQSQFVREQNGPVERVEVYLSPSDDVSAVLGLYNLTLPKVKKGQPEWRVPPVPCYGEVEGLPGMRGRLVLTNGITGILIKDDGVLPSRVQPWFTVHYDRFIADKDETLPADLPKPTGKTKREAGVSKFLEGFTMEVGV